MKQVGFILGLIAVIFSCTSCEDVIDVNLSTEEPRLIVDAIIRVDTTQLSTLVTVKVGETNSFFETIPPADLRQITLVNLDNPGNAPNPPVLIEEEPGSGIYMKSYPTSALVEDSWLLQIDFDDRIFVARGEFIPTSPIDNLEQGPGDLFGDNETELIVTFTDNPERDDYYLFDFDFSNFLVTEDEFYQGQEFSFSYFYNDQVEAGETIEVSVMGADEGLFNYMDKVIEQSEGGFGPFQTPAITVRGNIINATEIDNIDFFDNTTTTNNFALGYFAIVQEYKANITLKN